jgi:hypothetical protein
VSGVWKTLASEGELSIEDSQPRVSSSYDVAWRYHQVTPQVRRAQTVMPVELLTFLLPGNTEPCVDQRPGPLRRTPRRNLFTARRPELQPLIEHCVRWLRAVTTSEQNAPITEGASIG